MQSSLAKRPLTVILAFFALGIYAAGILPVPFWAAALIVLILLVLSSLFLRRAAVIELLLLTLIFFLGVFALKGRQLLPGRHFSKYLRPAAGVLYTVRGYADSQPVSKNGIASFVFQAQAIQAGEVRYPCCGSMLVRIKGECGELRYADGLVLRGSLSRPFRFPGGGRLSGYREYLYRQGIFYIMRVPAPALTQRSNYCAGSLFKRLAFRLEDKCHEIFLRLLPDIPASILSAMVLGERRGIPELVSDSMVKSGTIHILVVSGFNVGLVVFVFSLLLKLSRLPRSLRPVFIIPVIILYCFMTGASTPVVRATLMAMVLILAGMIKREADIYNSLAQAAICILAINPAQLFDIGCQLSFASVFSIACFYPRLKALLRVERLKAKCLKYPAEGLLVSLSAWLGTAGFVAYYFRIISPITVLANIFIVPLASFITLCGFSMVAAALVSAPFAPFFAQSSEFAVTLLLRINAFLVKLPGAYFYLP